MNHTQFCIGIFACLKMPTKEECMKLIFYLYGDYSIKVITPNDNTQWIIFMRDGSKLYIKEEKLHEVLDSKGLEKLSFEEWIFDGLPWDERNTQKQRSQGENRSD